MRNYPVPDNEGARVESLRALELLGSPREPEFDSIVALACAVFHVPIALIVLVDEQRQWFKAAEGLSLSSTERESAFCNYPVASGQPFVVNDALLDERFGSNRLVIGGPLIRFYAGAPLSIDAGFNLGTLCIIDTKPRLFTEDETRQLTQLAEIVAALFRQHRDTRALAAAAAELEKHRRESKMQAAALARSKSLFERASELTKMGAWELDLASEELTWTDGMYDIHELPRGSSIAADQVYAFYPERTRRDLQRLLNEQTQESAGYTFEGPMVTAKGNKRWIRLTGDVECENGVVVRRFGMKQDITAQKAVWDRMRFLAEYDPLTGLASRSVFEKRLRKSEQGTDQLPVQLALLLIDLDGFKHVNDTFGHAVGDECLRQMAKRLRRSRPDADIIARLGGDEFVLLLNVSGTQISAEDHAERLLAELRRPIRWGGQSFQLSGSIGVATTTHAGGRPNNLFTEADMALYAAKGAGRNTFRLFTPDMKASAQARYDTVRTISKALRDNQLELFYQPKIDLSKDTLSGFEALLRWRRPDGQIVAAGAFAAALEDPELADRIGDWVIKKALRQAQEWHQAGQAFGSIAINLSPGQFRTVEFAHQLVQQIADHGLQTDMIEVEVTESVFLSQEANVTKTILEILRKAGIRIALDDFGTGFASLSHLRTYPVDIIKIDKSFVQNSITSFEDHAIVEATLFLANQLHLEVVAEGIEHVEQSELLKALGCRNGQGYLYSKAVCASEAMKWFNRLPRAA